jgi:hypothetical protein
MDEGRGKLVTEPIFRKANGYVLDRSAVPHGNVALDWSYNPTGELAAWASCFHSSAETLLQALSSRETYEDREACPIVFLYRHALELCLKALLLERATLSRAEGEALGFSEQLLVKHNLRPLILPLQDTFGRFNYSWSSDGSVSCSYEDMLEVVEELDGLDSGSHAFRYPVTKSFNSPSLPLHLRFDVFEFSRRASRALEGLQALITRVHLEVCRNLADDDEEMRE